MEPAISTLPETWHSLVSTWKQSECQAGQPTFSLFREQDLGHHALVLVIQQMTMEY
jgi:hypothetical protein